MIFKKAGLFISAWLLFSALLACNSTAAQPKPAPVDLPVIADDRVKVVNGPEAKKLLDQRPDIIVLDVRTPQEYAGGHLKNAQLMDFTAPDFAQKISQLNPAKTYLVYCAVGGRSKKATNLMQQKGFKQIFDATVGFSALKKAGLATE